MFVIMVQSPCYSWFIAQLNSDYQTDYEDIVDHARLNSARIIVTTMEQAWRSEVCVDVPFLKAMVQGISKRFLELERARPDRLMSPVWE